MRLHVLAALALTAVTAPAAWADGLSVGNLDTTLTGVTVPGANERYFAIRAGRDTLVTSVYRAGGLLQRYDTVPGAFTIPGSYLDYDDAIVAPLLVPRVAPSRGVVLDGRLPNWLYAALARVYTAAAWVGVYETRAQPPYAVVVRSRLERLPIGSTYPIAPAQAPAPMNFEN